MITYSIIQKSQLEGALRLDAEYYQPEYLEVESKISQFGKWHYFGDLIEIFNSGKNWPQIEKGEIKFLRTQHIRNILIQDEEDLTFCEYKPPQYLLLKEGDILFTRVGGVRDNSVASKEYEGHFYSDNVLRIRIKKLDPFFVSAFLNCYFGKSQLERVMKGIAQPLISRENFEKLKVPEPSKQFQREIKNFIIEAYNLRDKAISLYSQAENLLLEELGLKDFKVEDDLSYIVNLSQIKSAHRADAEYFQPKYEKIEKMLSKRSEPLGKNFLIIKGKNFKYEENGEIGVIQTKQLTVRYINLEVENNTTIDTVRRLKLPLVQNSDVLFASMGVGSLGKANIFYEFESNKRYTIDSTIKILRAKRESNVYPEVLNVFINSYIGRELIYRYIVGSSGIISIYENYLTSLLIPILPKPTQQKIADLVQKSHEARKKAKELLEEAKRKVEELIEKG